MNEIYLYLVQQIQMLGYKVIKNEDSSLIILDQQTKEKRTLTTVKEVIEFIQNRRY